MENRLSGASGWYPLRVSAGGMGRFRLALESSGIESYYRADAFCNICFARSTEHEIDAVISALGSGITVHYLWDGVTFRPARIPERLMRDFMTVAESHDGSRVYLERVSTLLKDCQRVRVTSGEYSGIEGRLVRIRKTKRVMVALPGDIAVATGYIRPECMEEIL